MLVKGKAIALSIMVCSFLILGSVMLAGKILGRSTSQQQAEIIVKYSEDPQDAAAVIQASEIPTSSSVAGIAIFVLTALAAALVITIVIHYRGTILEQSFF